MSFETETFMKKLKHLSPHQNVNAPWIYRHYGLNKEIPIQFYGKHWIDDIPHDVQ